MRPLLGSGCKARTLKVGVGSKCDFVASSGGGDVTALRSLMVGNVGVKATPDVGIAVAPIDAARPTERWRRSATGGDARAL